MIGLSGLSSMLQYLQYWPVDIFVRLAQDQSCRLTSVSVLLSSWCSSLKVPTYGLFLSPCCWNHYFSIFASWRWCDFLWLLLQVSNCDKIWRPTLYPYCLPHCVWVEASFLSRFFTEKNMLETPSLLLKTAVNHGSAAFLSIEISLLDWYPHKSVLSGQKKFTDKYPVIFIGKLGYVWLYVQRSYIFPYIGHIPKIP